MARLMGQMGGLGKGVRPPRCAYGEREFMGHLCIRVRGFGRDRNACASSRSTEMGVLT